MGVEPDFLVFEPFDLDVVHKPTWVGRVGGEGDLPTLVNEPRVFREKEDGLVPGRLDPGFGFRGFTFGRKRALQGGFPAPLPDNESGSGNTFTSTSRFRSWCPSCPKAKRRLFSISLASPATPSWNGELLAGNVPLGY